MKTRIGASAGFGSASGEERDVAEHPAESDEEPGRERVRRAAAHRLVRRVPDVRRRLADAAAHPGDERRDRLDEQNVARLVLVAGDARALRDIDAADHGENRERQRERDVLAHRDRQPFEEPERRQRKRERESSRRAS